MPDPKKTQQAIETQLKKFEFPDDEQEATYQEVFGPMHDWILELGEQKLLLDPILKEWFFFDKLHQQWTKTGFGPGQVEFVPVRNKLGIKQLQLPEEKATLRLKPVFMLAVDSPDYPDPLTVSSEFHIGRGKNNQIMLKDELSSRSHARIFPAGASLMIEDLGTTNGTEVNGIRIQSPVELKIGDRITIGDTQIEVRAKGSKETSNG